MPRGGDWRGGRGGGQGSGRGGIFPRIGNILSDSTSSGSSDPCGQGESKGKLSIRGLNAVGFDHAQLSEPKATKRPTDARQASQMTLASDYVSRTPIIPTALRAHTYKPSKFSHQTHFLGFYSSRGTDYNNRPLEEEGDAKYIAGTAAAVMRRKPHSKFRRGDPAESRALFAPVAFVSASGEWKDGRWTGREQTSQDEQSGEGSQQRYDTICSHKSGDGLDFSATRQPTGLSETEALRLPPAQQELQRDQKDDGFLRGFPGSRELDQSDEFCMLDQSSSRISNAQLIVLHGPGTNREPQQASSTCVGANDSEVQMSLEKASAQNEHHEDKESDDEEIFIPMAASQSANAMLIAHSDSDEERQLDAITVASCESTQPKEESAASTDAEEAFILDFTAEPARECALELEKLVTSAPLLGDQIYSAAAAAFNPEAAPKGALHPAPSSTVSQFDGKLTGSSDGDGFVPVVGTRRSSNRKKTGRKARNAAKKARGRAKKTSVAGNWDIETPTATAMTLFTTQSRTEDSDIEKGSDGPPETSSHKSKRTRASVSLGVDSNVLRLRNLSLDHAADLPKTRAGEEPLLGEALTLSVVPLGDAGRDRSQGSIAFSQITKQTPVMRGKRSISRREREQEAILTDYMENALLREHREDSETADETCDMDEHTDMDAMIRFIQGMDPQGKGRQMTLGDIDDEMRMAEEEKWMTGSDEDEGDDDGEVSKKPLCEADEIQVLSSTVKERIFAHARQEEIGESALSSDDAESDDVSDYDEGSDDNDDDEEEEEAAGSDSDSSNVEEEVSSDSSSGEGEDESERLFDRDFSWATGDENFISKIERFCEDDNDVVTGKDRKARNKLFKAIETGAFKNEDLIGLAPAPKKRGQRAQETWDNGDVWAEQLQRQWVKDRQTKAVNKRKRAAERQAATLNPLSNMHKKGNKKTTKKAARVAQRAGKKGIAWQDNDADDADCGFNAGLPVWQKANKLHRLNDQIYEFLEMDGHSSLALPPMDKRSRAQVHMLASAYSITSKSRGQGRSRFITLIKTSRSGHQVDTRKVDRILRGHSFASFRNPGKKTWTTSKAGGKSRDAGAGLVSVQRNMEGADVGWGADRIGADNIGHKLLSAMGWAEGSGVGASQGMAEPIEAKIKMSKGGLGF